MDNRENLLNKIRQLEFATLDLSIFLDNFPDNKSIIRLQHILKTAYETYKRI